MVGCRGYLEDALEADALLANVARMRPLGALADGAEGAHVALGEADLVAAEGEAVSRDLDLERGQDIMAVVVVVAVLNQLWGKNVGENINSRVKSEQTQV
jgi:hypothetical protein